MVANKLRLTPAPRINMNGVTVPTCTTHKHLEITLNSSLTWRDHINFIYSTCARQVGILARLRNVLTKITVKKNIHWIYPSSPGICKCRLERRKHREAFETAGRIRQAPQDNLTIIENPVRLTHIDAIL